MNPDRASGFSVFVRAILLLIAGEASADIGTGSDKSYLAASKEAMSRMMSGMDRPSLGDVDQDFIAQMIPHHQGAIEMATAELRFGRNEHLRRIAQEIVVEQCAEIAALHREQRIVTTETTK